MHQMLTSISSFNEISLFSLSLKGGNNYLIATRSNDFTYSENITLYLHGSSDHISIPHEIGMEESRNAYASHIRSSIQRRQVYGRVP